MSARLIQTTPTAVPPIKHTKLLLLLIGIPVSMLVLGFTAMPAAFTLWCKLGGGSQNPNSTTIANQAPVTTGRFITIYWSSQIFDRLPVTFRVVTERERLEVGKEGRNVYRITNLADHPVRLRPIHQVSPMQATNKFGMRLCFCFKDQELAAHEQKEFEVTYTFDPSLDERVNDVFLKYSLFEAKDGGPTPEQLALEAQIKAAAIAYDDEAGTTTAAAPSATVKAAP